MTTQPNRRRGQALILITLALFAMCGLLGLAVDLGWGYFVKKSAQASGDAAALAAAYTELNTVGQTATITGSGSSGSCGTYSNPSTPGDTNLAAGCEYARQTGFGGSIAMVSGVGTTPPTVPNVTVDYWATARPVQTIPQLFSAVLGNPTGISSARSTAAIITENVNGALHALNRQFDNISASGLGQGADIGIQGGDKIIVPGGLVISSASANAGSAGGSASVTGPISIVSPGDASSLPANGSPVTDVADSSGFLDPYRGFGQPALPSTALATYGVVSGNLSSGNVYLLNSNTISGVAIKSPTPFPSGNYVAITCNPCTNGAVVTLDTTDQLTLNSTATFNDTSGACYGSTTNLFGCFFFYGGLNVGSVTMSMGAGEFVMVGGGAPAKKGANNGDLSTSNKGFLDSLVSCPNPSSCTTAGDILIMTGSSSAFVCGGSCSGPNPPITGNSNGDLYPGLMTQLTSNEILAQAAVSGMLDFGPVQMLSGADSASAAVTGLVAKNLPSNASGLVSFDGVVFWQDQANSTIDYTANGNINDSTSCGGGGDVDHPCTKTLPVSGSEAMTFQANASAGLSGIVYQPRGAFIQTQGGPGSGIQGAIQIITGAISMQGHGTISTTLPATSAKRRVVALIE